MYAVCHNVHDRRSGTICVIAYTIEDANKTNHGLNVYFEHKFGGLTTSRRNLALAARKQLKADNKITSGYVAFPARLMIKTSTNRNEKYHLHKDFSNEEIVFKKKPGK